MFSFYKAMRNINRLMNKGVTELNKADAEYIFEMTAGDELQEILIYLGCEVTRVADIFNVKMPETKFTRDEMNTEKRIEQFA